MLESFALGAEYVFTVPCLAVLFIGVCVGIVFGAIPGLTANMAIALCLPLTYTMSMAMGMSLLIALFIGGISGGLIAAILTRIPGTPSSIATCWDGYPLMAKGQGVKALGVGIVFSFLGTMFSICILIFMAPLLADVAVQFGAYEYFAVAVFSLTLIAGLTAKSLSRGIISGVLGCMCATVGIDPCSNMLRYTFGSSTLAVGFNILPVLIGLFAVYEIMSKIEKANTEGPTINLSVDMKGVKGFGFSWAEFWGQKWNLLRSAAIGTTIGILPGIGASTSNVLAYSVAKNQSKYPEKFGTGIIDGLVASESANNASIGGAMVPLLALGIPGDTVTALLIGALTLKGISPGPLLFIENVDLVYSVFIAMILASVVMLFVEFYGLRVIAKMLGVPKEYLLPAIFIFCIVGTFCVHNNIMDVWAVLVFGLVGFAFEKLGIPAPPFILGFILGPLAEINLRRGLMLAQGDFFKFFESPIAVFFFVLTLISLYFSARKVLKK